jgi:thiosulfate/3-mercaptopyruvate sulfurtransferase
MRMRAAEFKLNISKICPKVSLVTHTTLLSTDELAAHLADRAWVIVDCRYDLTNEAWGEEQYRTSHIPGAAYASLAHDLAGPTDGRNGRHPMPGHEAMAATFGRWGITDGIQVAAYDQENGMYASRLWWMLRYMGHDAVAVLNGGFAKWTREGRPTARGTETRPAATFTGKPRAAMRLTANQVWAKLGDPALTLVDARAPSRFEGKEETLDKVGGHVPGALNHFFQWNLAPDGTFLPAEALREKFTALLGKTPPAEVATYCGSGVTACHNLLAMELAGMSGARLFPGSWSEWSADPDKPVATGPSQPRSG